MVPVIRKSLQVGAIFILATSSPLFADRVTLNTGEEIEGIIVQESETEVVFEHTVGNGIIDQRTILKDDIKTISKTPTDAVDFNKIKGFKPGPNSLSAAAYDSAVTQLYRFIAKHKESTHLAEVRANIEALKSEKARVAKGDLKWNNRWYTPKEAAEEKYQIGAFRLYVQMREQARTDLVAALNSFDRLEKSFPGSRSYPDAVELATTLILHLNNEIDRVVPLAKLKKQQFEEGVVILKEPDRSQTMAARKTEVENAEAAMAAASKAGVKWAPLLPIIDKSPDSLRNTATAELERLRRISVGNMRSSITSADAAFQEVTAKNLALAEEKLSEAKSLWPQNELLAKLAPAVKGLKDELAATPEPSPSPNAASAPATAANPK